MIFRSGNVWCKNLVVKFYVKFSCDEPMNSFLPRIFERPGLCYDVRRSLFYISGTQNLFHVIKMDIDNHLKTREETLKRIGGLKGKKISLFDLVHHGQAILIIYYRPQTKLRKGNVFTSVCQEFCPRGIPPTPHQTATAADGTHPIVMHSCFIINVARMDNFETRCEWARCDGTERSEFHFMCTQTGQ